MHRQAVRFFHFTQSNSGTRQRIKCPSETIVLYSDCLTVYNVYIVYTVCRGRQDIYLYGNDRIIFTIRSFVAIRTQTQS